MSSIYPLWTCQTLLPQAVGEKKEKPSEETDGDIEMDAEADGEQVDGVGLGLDHFRQGPVPLQETFFYKEPSSTLLGSSNHAHDIGLKLMSTLDIMMVKAQLEHITWSLFAEEMQAASAGLWLMINVTEAGSCFAFFCFYCDVVICKKSKPNSQLISKDFYFLRNDPM